MGRLFAVLKITHVDVAHARVTVTISQWRTPLVLRTARTIRPKSKIVVIWHCLMIALKYLTDSLGSSCFHRLISRKRNDGCDSWVLVHQFSRNRSRRLVRSAQVKGALARGASGDLEGMVAI